MTRSDFHFGRDAVTDHEFVESRVEMEEILRREVWGCLGLCADVQPYVVPINYAYVDGRILFHCALEGEKLDCIRAARRGSSKVWQSAPRYSTPSTAHSTRMPRTCRRRGLPDAGRSRSGSGR